MIDWYPTWQEAAGAALVFAATATILRARVSRATGVQGFFREAGILVGLFALWQLAGKVGAHAPGGALERGDSVVGLERALHLPAEAHLQNLLLPHSTTVRFFNSYYAYAHANVLLITLLWLFLRHRKDYAAGRTALALTTGACLAIQLALPTAPPRLLSTGAGGPGLVDTAAAYGQSVYGPVGQGLSDQYAALPSVHIAWAVAVAWLVWRSAHGAWRVLGVAHLALTAAVVVTTGNHYWADGLVAAGLFAIAVVVAGSLPGTRKRLPLPEPREALTRSVRRRVPVPRRACSDPTPARAPARGRAPG